MAPPRPARSRTGYARWAPAPPNSCALWERLEYVQQLYDRAFGPDPFANRAMLVSVANELRTLLNDLCAPRHIIDGLNRIFHPYDFHGRHTSPLIDREIQDIIIESKAVKPLVGMLSVPVADGPCSSELGLK